MIPTTNLLPAILIAAPHHSGKSVLAYLLSQHLRDAHVPHILLRAAPDGGLVLRKRRRSALAATAERGLHP
jgi:thymidylate kinase